MSQVVLRQAGARDHVGFYHRKGELVKIISETSRSNFDGQRFINVVFLSNNERGMLRIDEIEYID